MAPAGLVRAGFKVLPGQHPIIPVMLGMRIWHKQMALALKRKGVRVLCRVFSSPVVPKGQARIRTQMNAGPDPKADLMRLLEAFTSGWPVYWCDLKVMR